MRRLLTTQICKLSLGFLFLSQFTRIRRLISLPFEPLVYNCDHKLEILLSACHNNIQFDPADCSVSFLFFQKIKFCCCHGNPLSWFSGQTFGIQLSCYCWFSSTDYILLRERSFKEHMDGPLYIIVTIIK